MSRKIVSIAIMFLLAILQLTMMPYLAVWGTWPNLIVIAVILLLLFRKGEDAFFMTIIGGLVLDLGGSLRLGLNMLMLVGLFYLARGIIYKYFPEPNIIIVFLSCLLAELIYSLVTLLFLWRFPLEMLLIQALYGGILGSILFLFFSPKQKSTIIKINNP